jgi:hypothetical protein
MYIANSDIMKLAKSASKCAASVANFHPQKAAAADEGTKC